MADVNWALAENGAQVTEVSHEAARVASSAGNLLQSREDALWVTGDAPQHVTLSLSPSHPPLHYAGWHVWHDYLTNPRMVEIASGATPSAMTPLLVCQALPGAGTQVWRLPRSIPAEHRHVRFTIVETFGPGPTYMNNIVLLEKDPGPNYNAHEQADGAHQGATPASTDDFLRGSSIARHSPAIAAAATASPYVSPPPSALRHPNGGADRSPPPRWAAAAPGPTGAAPGATGRGGHLGDVGVFVTSGPSTPAYRVRGIHGGADGRSPGGVRSSSRMSQLLRDLDDDIKMLKPITTVSPGKNMLVYVPQDAPSAPPASGSEEGAVDKGDSSDEDTPGGRRHHHHRRHHRRSGSRHARHGDGSGGGSGERRGRNGTTAPLPEGGHASATPPPPPPASASPMTVAVWPSAAVEPGSVYDARLSALEQAVAALNVAVHHQRDDLAMIKRVLLQQATERRKEAEQRHAERQSAGALAVAPQVHLATPPASSAPPHTAAPDTLLTHRSITVGFPEDALRAYVESVLDHKLHKHVKKVEARLLQRLDKQLHDVVKILSATVEARLVPPPQSPPRSVHVDRSTPLQTGGFGAGLSSAVRGAPRGAAAGPDGPSIHHSDGASSPSSSKGHYYHTPVARADGGSAFSAAYGAPRGAPLTNRAVAAVPSVSIAKSSLS
ncbi:hypothetical protein NESM_000455300 [Novymonas esmeraldas]|uniref:Uncharacterized protein n=1 Tax=Novymonas esmeraldas TaxID=1808958 RepID=A0AAW0EME5_9TRYP